MVALSYKLTVDGSHVHSYAFFILRVDSDLVFPSASFIYISRQRVLSYTKPEGLAAENLVSLAPASICCDLRRLSSPFIPTSS
jgi:hypothetical protein